MGGYTPVRQNAFDFDKPVEAKETTPKIYLHLIFAAIALTALALSAGLVTAIIFLLIALGRWAF